MGTCVVNGCVRPVKCKARGLCNAHYLRWQRKGDVLAAVPLVVKHLNNEGAFNTERDVRITCVGHPLANSEGRALLHRVLLFEKIGPGSHACHWCEDPVTWRTGADATRRGSLVVDHLDANSFNNATENLVPACSGCNNRRARAGNPLEWVPPALSVS